MDAADPRLEAGAEPLALLFEGRLPLESYQVIGQTLPSP
jgi:hypothetical protein